MRQISQYRVVFLLFLSLGHPGAWAQSQPAFRYVLHVNPSDFEPLEEALQGLKPIGAKDGLNTVFMLPDSSGATALSTKIIRYLQEKSYLLASIDRLQIQSNEAQAFLHLGPPMQWVRLQLDTAIPRNWLQAAGYKEKLYQRRLFNAGKILQLERSLLEQSENNGYPFAIVWLDSISVDSTGGMKATLKLDKKRFFSTKRITVTGDLKLPKSYLAQYLGWTSDRPYSRAQLLRVREQLQSLPFVEQTANPSVTFSGQEAILNLYLQKKRAGRFDFIIGLLPQTNSSKLLLTGNLNAAFQNTFGIGERFSVEFERLRPETQRLEASAASPYLWGTSFGLDGKLQIFRRDSTWVDAQSELGVQYLFVGGNYLRFLWENRSSSLQKVDTQAIINNKRLPPNLDLRQNGFGVGAGFNRLDYRFNPRKGWMLQLKAVAGFNQVLRNNQIENLKLPGEPSFSFSSLYDSIAQKATRYRIEANIETYLPLFARSTLKFGFRGSGIFSQKPIFNNEQYRIGGAKTLRGFDEESLFATRFAIFTTELRLIISRNTFLSVFSDIAYIENTTNLKQIYLRPRGLGAGLNIETQAGIFGISMAVGKSDIGQDFDLRATKFHLGYVSLF
jgi:outer membrane protein assembly factor BamA